MIRCFFFSVFWQTWWLLAVPLKIIRELPSRWPIRLTDSHSRVSLYTLMTRASKVPFLPFITRLSLPSQSDSSTNLSAGLWLQFHRKSGEQTEQEEIERETKGRVFSVGRWLKDLPSCCRQKGREERKRKWRCMRRMVKSAGIMSLCVSSTQLSDLYQNMSERMSFLLAVGKCAWMNEFSKVTHKKKNKSSNLFSHAWNAPS